MKKVMLIVVLLLSIGVYAQVVPTGFSSDNIKPLDFTKCKADDYFQGRAIQGYRIYENIMYMWSKDTNVDGSTGEFGMVNLENMEYTSLGKPADGYFESKVGIFNSFITVGNSAYDVIVGFTSTGNVDDRLYKVDFTTDDDQSTVWQEIAKLTGNFDAEYFGEELFVSATGGEIQNNIYKFDLTNTSYPLEASKVVETFGSSAGIALDVSGNIYYATSDWSNPNGLYKFKRTDLESLTSETFLTIAEDGIKLADLPAGSYDTDCDDAGNIVFNINQYGTGYQVAVWNGTIGDGENYSVIAEGFGESGNWFGIINTYGDILNPSYGDDEAGVIVNDAYTSGLTKITFLSEDVEVADFETLTFADDQDYWNGSDGSGCFSDKKANFMNNYYTGDYPYWNGFSYSKANNTETAGYENQYSIYHGAGAYESANFALGNGTPEIKFSENIGEYGYNLFEVNGFYLSNSTYAALSMTNGDGFAKKFGGESGDDPDWFKLTITPMIFNSDAPGTPLEGTVRDIYLADYRFIDNNKDYILKDWLWVDLEEFGQNIVGLKFSLSSSDNGDYGMNTPAYFAMDNLILKHDSSVGIKEDLLAVSNLSLLSNYPNPFNPTTNISFNLKNAENVELSVYNNAGQLVKRLLNNRLSSGNHLVQFDAKSLTSGVYYYKVKAGNKIVVKKMILMK